MGPPVQGYPTRRGVQALAAIVIGRFGMAPLVRYGMELQTMRLVERRARSGQTTTSSLADATDSREHAGDDY
jgi:hypothetical protein